MIKLRDYQIEGAKFLASRKKAILQMGCGMGKTITSLYACPLYKPIMVVAPPALKEKWEEEASKMRRVIRFVSSYNKQQLRDLHPHFTIIIDEAHDQLKSWNKDQHLIKQALRSKYCYMLTATPLINDPLPYYWILKICGVSWSKDQYKFKFCGGERLKGRMSHVVVMKGPTNLDLLKKIKKPHTFSKFRKLKIVQKEINLGPAPIGTSETLESYSNVENLLGIMKTRDENFIKNLKKSLTGVSKCVIFFIHREVGRSLKNKFGGFYIDGEIPFKRRNEIFKKFKEGNLFINSKACGVGVDIEEVDRVIFAERTWSPFRDYQAYMRCYRMKRDRILEVHFLDYEDEAKLLVGKRKEILKGV